MSDRTDDRELTAAIRANTRQLATLTKEIRAMSQDQSHLDADVQALQTGIVAVEKEIADLKNQPQAAALDFSALDAAVAQIQGDAPAPTPPAA